MPAETPIRDPDLIRYFRERLVRGAEIFAVPPVEPDPLLLVLRPGGPPERVPLLEDGSGCRIFISTETHFSAARYELAHEACHEALSHGFLTLDWVEEMFAEYVALLAVRELEVGVSPQFAGEYAAYAAEREDRHRRDAPKLPLRSLRAADLREGYPEFTYARAFVTAEELVGAIGWAALSRLGSSFDADHRHDISSWISGLEPSEREVVRCVLGS